jgi:DNA-binding MarR family transcriptional regulator
VSDVGGEFDSLMRANGALHRTLLGVGESIAAAAGQSHARSQCLQQIADEPRTVAAIAVRLGMTRQSVQRVADLLVTDGLAGYADNPHHRRAQLLSLTAAGHRALELMGAQHHAWVRKAASVLDPAALAAVAIQLNAINEALLDLDRSTGST